MTRDLAVVVLAAGKGSRMKSDLPKVMHPVAGRPMIGHVLDTARRLQPQRIVVVIGPDMERVATAAAPDPVVVQPVRDGTGGAVAATREVLADFSGTVLVLYGDTPLIGDAILQQMLAHRAAPPHPAVVVAGFRPADPGLYGRLILDPEGNLTAIVEARDATPAQLAVNFCNAGVMAVDGARLFGLLDRITNNNAKRERYLTDIVGLARADGLPCAAVAGPPEELSGVDSRADQAWAEAMLQDRLRQAAMEAGVTLRSPDTVWLAADTTFGRDVVVEPHVVFGPGVSVGNGAHIQSFSHLEQARIGPEARVGPHARLRPGAVIDSGARVGNFVEIKNARLAKGAKASHLAYIGDAEVGPGSNVGAGTIFANYDGYRKHRSHVGRGVLVGSNSVLVAPVTVGDGAVVGAGSVLTGDVAADAVVTTRAPRTEKPGAATDYHARRSRSV